MRLFWVCYPTIMTGLHGWRQRRTCSNSKVGEHPPSEALPYLPGLYPRLVRPAMQRRGYHYPPHCAIVGLGQGDES